MKIQGTDLKKKVTGTDIARAVGCSQASVSKVMNNDPHVSGFLREKVLEQARKLNYQIRNGGPLRHVALILPAPCHSRLDGYAAAMLNAMLYELDRRNIELEIIQENHLHLLLTHAFDGGISIAWEPGLTADWFELFDLPLIRINAYPDSSDRRNWLAYVNMVAEKSMERLLDKLYSLNHRRIILLAPEPQEIEQRRKRYVGFYNYLKSKRVLHPEHRCIFAMRSNSFEENLVLLKNEVSKGATALIGVDESYVRTVLSLVEALKLNIPNRISLVCWEQKEILPYFDPPVTGMEIDYKQLCEAAVDLLAKLCRGEKVDNVYIPFRLFERESVAPACHKKSGGKLADRILAHLANGPDSRFHIASVLGVKPYSGYFSRTLLYLLNSKQIVYGQKSPTGRNRLLQLLKTDHSL